MPRAVGLNNDGGLEVLQVVEVDRPKPGSGKVLVRVKAAGINPGEASNRKGLFAERWRLRSLRARAAIQSDIFSCKSG
jgi:NADPH:quinone reductase-like Zn-dependent oxidoreductase